MFNYSENSFVLQDEESNNVLSISLASIFNTILSLKMISSTS